MKKSFFLFLSSLLLCPAPLLFPQAIPSTEVAEYASAAFAQRNPSPEKGSFTVKTIDYAVEQGDSLMGIVNFSPKGFIIMGMNEKTTPVWAYSTENNFIDPKMSHAAFTFLDDYKSTIAADLAQETAEPEKAGQWAELKMKTNTAKGTPVVSPLVMSQWNQNKYYNQLSPMDPESPAGYDGRVPNGCVAVAMGMILHYYRHPESGTGSHTNHTGYGNFTVDFAGRVYNYNAMQDVLDNYNHEVAQLIFDCATSVDMNYAPSGSGAMSYDAASAMVRYFKYSSSREFVLKSWHSHEEWRELLKSDLNIGRPVYYAGRSEAGGHAFVCDGYDDENLFHFNFGWGGSGNGYYVVDNSSDAVGGYSSEQSAIIHLYPTGNYPDYCGGTTWITSSSGTLEDGSNTEPYANNSQCTYILAPSNTASFSIQVERLRTEAAQDTLSFWKGNPSRGLLQRTLSGSVDNLSFTIETDTLYITFHSNEDVADEGWRISYNTLSSLSSCRGYTILTDQNGTFSDGSSNGTDYAPCSECFWLLRPLATSGNYDNITFTFNYFDLSPEDRLIFYNSEGVPEIVNIFTGSAPPPSLLTYPYRQMRIDFISDNYLEKNGFEAHWATGTTSIPSVEQSGISIHPNPASRQATVSLPSNQSGGDFELLDLTGKAILRNHIPAGEPTIQLNTSDLPSGIYVLRIALGGSVHTGKLIIE